MTRSRAATMSGDTHRSLEADVACALRSAILKGDFAPGTRLIELDLAARFDVSQGTVRAALKSLLAQGLVEHRPRRGSFVVNVEKADISEISELRDALEALGARLAAKRVNDSGRRALERILRAMRTAAEAGNRVKLIELDLEFHRTIIEISGHRRLMEIYIRLEGQIRLFLGLTDQFYPEPLNILGLHEPLAAAICSGDAETAFRLANRHADADAEELIAAMA